MMQAIIMAAGRGTRLAPLTDDCPKCLLSLGNQSIIEYQLGILNQYGIDDIIIVTGYRTRLLKKKLKDRNITSVFNPFYETTNVLSSFWFAQDKLNDDFIYLHGDTVFDIHIFERMLEREADIVLPVDFKECAEEEMKVSIENDQITSLSKKLPLEESVGEFIGIAKISNVVLEDLRIITENFMIEKKFDLFFEAAIQGLIDSNQYDITFVKTNGYFWVEIDFVEDYELARKHFS